MNILLGGHILLVYCLLCSYALTTVLITLVRGTSLCSGSQSTGALERAQVLRIVTAEGFAPGGHLRQRALPRTQKASWLEDGGSPVPCYPLVTARLAQTRIVQLWPSEGDWASGSWSALLQGWGGLTGLGNHAQQLVTGGGECREQIFLVLHRDKHKQNESNSARQFLVKRADCDPHWAKVPCGKPAYSPFQCP